MPNTLGVAATELMSGKLLEGLADEQGGLFSRQVDLRADVPSDDEKSPIVRDMFAEMSGYDAAPRTRRLDRQDSKTTRMTIAGGHATFGPP